MQASTRFMIADSGATDKQHASLGLALNGLTNARHWEQVLFSHKHFRSGDDVLSLIACDVEQVEFLYCIFSDAALSSLSCLIEHAANIRRLRLHKSLLRGSMCKLVDAFRRTTIRGIDLCVGIGDDDDDGTDALVDAIIALGRNRRVKQLRIEIHVSDSQVPRCHRMTDALRWNVWTTDVQFLFNVEVYDGHNEDVLSWSNPITELLNANYAVARIINAQTPPLGDGYGTDSGDWEALPNELVCAVAERVWPSSAALEMAHVCQRLRDCVLSDYVVRLRTGPDDADGYMGYGDWRLLYRAAWMEQQQETVWLPREGVG